MEGECQLEGHPYGRVSEERVERPIGARDRERGAHPRKREEAPRGRGTRRRVGIGQKAPRERRRVEHPQESGLDGAGVPYPRDPRPDWTWTGTSQGWVRVLFLSRELAATNENGPDR